MNLEQKINEELKNAMKNQDKVRTESLRSIRSAIIEFNKSGAGREMNEQDELKILNMLAKRRKDAMEMYEKGNRPDLFENEKKELEIISEFLPKQMMDEEIKEILTNLINENNATIKEMGKIMGAAMKQFAGKADGTKVQTILKELLG